MTKNRVRALQIGPLAKATARGDGEFARLAVNAIHRTLDAVEQEASASLGHQVAKPHEAFPRWTKVHLDLEQEALQAPTTVTSGIFQHLPTMLASSVPTEDQDKWGRAGDEIIFEKPDLSTWPTIPWTAATVTGLGFIDDEDHGHRLEDRLVAKAIATAATGHRCLLFLENQSGAPRKTRSAAAQARRHLDHRQQTFYLPTTEQQQAVHAYHLLTSPPSTLWWVTAGASGNGRWDKGGKEKRTRTAPPGDGAAQARPGSRRRRRRDRGPRRDEAD